MKFLLLVTSISMHLLVRCLYCMPICGQNVTEVCPNSHQVYNTLLERCVNVSLPYYSHLAVSRGGSGGRLGFGGRARHQTESSKTRRRNASSSVSFHSLLLIIPICSYLFYVQ